MSFKLKIGVIIESSYASILLYVSMLPNIHGMTRYQLHVLLAPVQSVSLIRPSTARKGLRSLFREIA